MSVTKASLLRRAALTLVAGAAIALPVGAQASLLGGLSLRVGAFIPQRGDVRDVTDVAAWGGGIEYQVPWVPRLFNGEAWSTSISVDFHYSQRQTGVYRDIPVSLNQVYTFEQRNGITPFAGFCVTAATYGTTGTFTFVPNSEQVGVVTRQAGTLVSTKQPTVTRFGGGLILGLNFGKNLYWEGRYEWIDGGHTMYVPEGFRTYIGYRF